MVDQRTITFRGDFEAWTAFQEKARREGTTGSQLLRDFMAAYLSGEMSVQHLQQDREPVPSVTAELAAMKERLEAVEVKLGKSSGEMNRYSDRKLADLLSEQQPA